MCISELFTQEENPLFRIFVRVMSQVLLYNGKEGRDHLNLDSGLPHAQGAIPNISPLLVPAGIMGSTVVGSSDLVMGD